MDRISSYVCYVSLYAVSAAIFSLSHYKTEGFLKKILFGISLLIPSIFFALRYNVGTDFMNYFYMFRENTSLSLVEYLSMPKDVPGIFLLSRVCGWSRCFNFFLFCLSFTQCFLVFSVIKKMSFLGPVGLMSFLFLIGPFTTGLNICKQVTAVCFVLYSIPFICQRNFWKYFFCLVVACCFHFTAIVALPIYWLWDDSSSKMLSKKMIFVFAYAFCAFFYSSILDLIGGRWIAYSSKVEVSFSNSSFVLILAWCFIFFFVCNKMKKNENFYAFFFRLFLIGVVFSAMGFISPYVKRIALYFTSMAFVLEAMSLWMFVQKKERDILKIALILYSIGYSFLSIYVLKQGDLLPYSAKLVFI